MERRLYFLFGLLLGLGFAPASAQLVHPKASPAQTIIQDVGLCQVQVSYSRPAVRGRQIFGNLVPYGRIWRVGANESTKIKFSCPVRIAGNKVPAGTYALYAFPQEDLWEIAIHKDTTHWGDGRQNYSPQDDLLRFTTYPQTRTTVTENFQIGFDQITHEGMDMYWRWDRLELRFAIEVDTQAEMEKQIATALQNNPTAQTYYEAARYLQESDRDYSRALGYLDQALELGGDTYYFHRVRSLVLAALGRYEEAVAAAGKSLKLAEAEGKDEFVRMNQKNIEKWNKLKD
ncbi:DUF2911 domain-containing protein [Robiginitalea myxolifaciens]|uniref:DUF2911 domain-containing protein n=1 Tax=Robiginitalea myxolifaciens TaxID=400055 RepID=UPI001FE26440|nr:DUF2911 domain-containing protein [Robiginitalea myxolifaciens]